MLFMSCVLSGFHIEFITESLLVANLQDGKDGGQNRSRAVIEIDWPLPQPSLHVRVQHEYRTEYVPAEGEDKEHAADVLARLGSVALDYLGARLMAKKKAPRMPHIQQKVSVIRSV